MGRGVRPDSGAILAAAPIPEAEAGAAERTEPTPLRIGVLGGTFDPPHVGHLWLGTLAADAMALDRVLFMPAAQPPHKAEERVSRATDRLLMTRLAIAADPTFELTAIEMERPGPSYTIDTVTELHELYGSEVMLYLVMAADSLEQIDTWREPDRLLDRIEWIVGPRPGAPHPERAALEARFGANASRIHLLEGPSLDVSSSEIRRRVAAGHAIRYLVPRGVEELIVDRGLYRRG
jgi:nicotinate-nucleotide adenylyltransferase